jgi:hypothetical protein
VATFRDFTEVRDISEIPEPTDGYPEHKFALRFIRSIGPQSAALTKVMDKYGMQQGENLVVGLAIEFFKLQLHEQPALRVHYPPLDKVPPAVKGLMKPVDYDIPGDQADLPKRPGQAEAEMQRSALWCEVCYALSHKGEHALFDNHNTPYCNRVLGKYDAMNPASNPGPGVVDIVEYLRRFNSMTSSKKGDKRPYGRGAGRGSFKKVRAQAQTGPPGQ